MTTGVVKGSGKQEKQGKRKGLPWTSFHVFCRRSTTYTRITQEDINVWILRGLFALVVAVKECLRGVA